MDAGSSGGAVPRERMQPPAEKQAIFSACFLRNLTFEKAEFKPYRPIADFCTIAEKGRTNYVGYIGQNFRAAGE